MDENAFASCVAPKVFYIVHTRGYGGRDMEKEPQQSFAMGRKL